MDKVLIRQLSIETVIGIYEWEKQIHQTLLVDLDMAWDNSAAAAADDYQHALCYETVSKRLTQLITEKPIELIETVAEMIAFRNAITPTELGDFLLEAFNEVSVPVQNAPSKIRRATTQLLEMVSKSFYTETKTFKSNVKHSMVFHTNQLIQSSRKLHAKTDLSIDRNRERINYLQKDLLHNQKRFIQDKNLYLDDASQFLSQNSIQFIEEQSKTIEQLKRSIQLLDPKNVLKRGYSIARLNGKTISESNVPKENDELEIESFEYRLTTKVSRISTIKK